FLVLLFLGGLLPYLYVPIAASHHPAISWDNASTLSNFLDLLLRRDYGGFAPGIVNQTPFSVKLLHIKEYFTMLTVTYTIPVVIVCVGGLILFGLKEELITISLLVMFIISGPFFAFYSAPGVVSDFWLGVVERFYQLSFIIFLFFFSIGLSEMVRLFKSKLDRPQYGIISYLFF